MQDDRRRLFTSVRWILVTAAVVANIGLLSSPLMAGGYIGYCSECSVSSGGTEACCVYSAVCEPDEGRECCNEKSDCGLN